MHELLVILMSCGVEVCSFTGHVIIRMLTMNKKKVPLIGFKRPLVRAVTGESESDTDAVLGIAVGLLFWILTIAAFVVFHVTP